MKPVIKVWCLPHEQSENDFVRLHRAIVGAVVSSKVNGVNGQDDMVVLMPTDLMKKGLGEEIIVEFDPANHSHAKECLKALGAILDAIKRLYPKAYVQGKLLRPDADCYRSRE